MGLFSDRGGIDGRGGRLVNLTVVPEVARAWISMGMQPCFHAMESLAKVLINVAVLGMYSLAGLVLLPAVFATPSHPRWLAWLGAEEWGPSVPHSGFRYARCCAVNQ